MAAKPASIGSRGTALSVPEPNAGRAFLCNPTNGIPADIRPSVLRPFFTTKRNGSGLGLAISARIVADHGGHIDFQCPETGGMDGVTTLARALDIHPEMIVVMMSAHSTVDTAVGAMKLGATDFLVKPFPLETLDSTVEGVLAAAQTRRQLAKDSTPALSTAT